MEKIFPFLYEDVLYKINEYTLHNEKKKELCEEIFFEYLCKNLIKLNIRFNWIIVIINMHFKNMNEFIDFLDLYYKIHYEYTFININNDIISFNINGMYTSDTTVYFDKNIANKLKEFYDLPLGPRIKIYHGFINK
tara:strand:+ start:1970 stop:2377 length:408 start_codon:yes stop_codon:yes gene_type:complete